MTEIERIAEAGTRLWIALWRKFVENGYGDMDSYDFQTIGVEAGLLEMVPYEPSKHGEIEDVEPGDTIWFPTALGSAMAATQWLGTLVNGDEA